MNAIGTVILFSFAIFDDFLKLSMLKVLKNIEKSSNMAKILAKNEEKPSSTFLQPIFRLIPGTRSARTSRVSVYIVEYCRFQVGSKLGIVLNNSIEWSNFDDILKTLVWKCKNFPLHFYKKYFVTWTFFFFSSKKCC